MNARAHQHTRPVAAAVPIAQAEHISIETPEEESQPRVRRAGRKVRERYKLVSRVHGCSTELSLLEDHFLLVQAVRPDGIRTKYDVDLRFASSQPLRVRTISWTWLIVTVGLIALASSAMFIEWTRSPEPWLRSGFIAAAITLCVSILTGFLFAHRTTESLQFKSLHGQATIVSVTGGIGSTRAGKAFFVELIKDINAAKALRPAQRQQLLRDEMREHHRLREAGALTEEEYEASKARILASHS